MNKKSEGGTVKGEGRGDIDGDVKTKNKKQTGRVFLCKDNRFI